MTQDDTGILLGYAIAFGAKKRQETYMDVLSGVWFVDANSHDEAVGKAVARAKHTYPPEDKYIDHWGIAVSVSMLPEFLQERLDKAVLS